MRRLRVLVVGLAAAVLFLLPRHPAEAASYPYNPFLWGQCTFWAFAQRPDLAGDVWGNAMYWGYEASVSGRRVVGYPSVGSIAVFQPYSYGADGIGHVAYVFRVYGSYFEVSEENFPFLGSVTYRWVHNQGGISFIE